MEGTNVKLKSITRRAISLVLALTLLVISSSLVSVFAEPSVEYTQEKLYKNFVILGDSICLGFSADNMSSFDIAYNAVTNPYPHSYPSVFAEMLGLDVTAADDGYTELYNFGICAAWQKDILDLLNDPFWEYTYGGVDDFDDDDLFVLPEDYTGVRYIVDTEAEGYDLTNPATWIYKMDEYWNYVGMEEYTVPAGTAIHVGYTVDYWGMPIKIMNSILQEKYLYLSRNCVGEDGNFIDTNDDGVVDESDRIYYPTVFDETTFMFAPSTDPDVVAEYGKSFRNPLWTIYYHDMVVDAIANGDLIALAAGGNDIYHSFMPYQSDTDSTLAQMIAMLGQMFMMDMGASDIIEMMSQTDMGGMDMGGMTNTFAMAPAVEETSDTAVMGNEINNDELQALLDHYSREKINAYMADVVADYKEYLEQTIIRVNELRSPESELILMGQFNPFGMKNYLQMLAMHMENGELFDKLGTDAGILGSLFKALIGAPEDYDAFAALTPNEQEAALASVENEMASISDFILNNPNFTRDEFDAMINHLSFPGAVFLIGNGLSDVYCEVNSIIKDLAEKYNLAYVDISEAPANGRYDPHPTAEGHKWIAERLYDAVTPTITANICCCGCGKGKITSEGATVLRLHDCMEYRIVPATGSKISAIFIDGQLLDREEYASVYESGVYVFDNILKDHTISVQFDPSCDSLLKYSVDVLGSYAAYGAGEGLYAPGATVYVDAGHLDGYEFAGWLVSGAELEDPTASYSYFTMPAGDVKVIATWKPLESEENPQPQYNTLSFVTNCDEVIPDAVLMEGTIIDIDAVIPQPREGYTFLGWYYDEALTAQVHEFILHSNTSVYAKWIDDETAALPLPTIYASISPFSTGRGQMSSIGANKVDHYGVKEFRMIPADDSYISGIFVDGMWLNPYDPLYKPVYDSGVYVFTNVNEDHTIVAQFSFIGDGLPRYVVDVLGSYDTTKAGGAGLYREGDIVYIDAGTIDGYEFDGWLVDGVELFDDTDPQTWFFMPAGNVSVVAKWIPLYNVYFDTNGGSEIEHYTDRKYTVLDLSDFETEREGFDFVAWYTDPELTEQVDEYTIGGNALLYAGWECTITFDSNGGSKIDPITMFEGCHILLDNYVPTKEDHTFAGWYTDEELTERISEYNFDGHLTVYAKWVRTPKTGDTFNMSLWMSLMAVAFVGMTSCGVIYRKCEKEDEE